MKNYGRKILSLAIVVAMVFSLGAYALAAEYSDMPSESHWAYKALNSAVSNGLLTGTDNGKLNPEANLSRAEMAAIITRAFGAVQSANISAYNDVSANAWYYSNIAKAVMMGVYKGDSTGTMRPESSITRQEAFVVLARAIKLTASDTSSLDKFSDKALLADWAKCEIAAMVTAGYVDGSAGKLNPTGNITRQEFAQVIYNTINSYISKAGTVTSVQSGNVMVNAAGVYLQDVTITGDLIVGDGVGIGDLTLDNVKVNGRMVVRGGGKNSIIIINRSAVGNIVIGKASDGAVRIDADASSSLSVIYVNDGKDGVIVEGNVTSLTIAGSTDVEIRGAVTNVTVSEAAAGSKITVTSGSTVGNLDSKANNISVIGTGKITTATVTGDNNAINVIGTKVTIGADADGTTLNGDTGVKGTNDVVEDHTNIGGGVTTYNVTLSISDGAGNATDPSSVSSTATSTAQLIPTIGMLIANNHTALSTAYGAVDCHSELRSILLSGASATAAQGTWTTFVNTYTAANFPIAAGYTGTVTITPASSLASVTALVSPGTYQITLVVSGPAAYSRTYTVTVTIS